MIFKTIIGTFSNKLLTTFLSFILVVLTSRFLGASGKGEISLLIANLVLVMHFANLISGTSIVYLTPRIKPVLLLVSSYIWCTFTSFVIVFLLYFFNLLNPSWVVHLFKLSLIYNLISTNYMILLGREKVKIYNRLTLFVVILTIIGFLFSFFVLEVKNPDSYIYGLYFSYVLIFLFSLFSIRKEFAFFNFSELNEAINKIVKTGFKAQFSNIITFINYRFSYYVLDLLFDSAKVGVFSVGVAISEAMWLMSKSIALVQYTKIVNEEDIKKAQNMTFLMAKFSFWITLCFIGIMILIPDGFYGLVFGEEFIQSKYVIYSLSFGILSIAVSTTFSHYFGGIGKFQINNIASLVGLFFTLSLTYFMSEKYGMIGAGLSASLAYFFSFLYLFYRFRKESNFNLAILIPTKEDFKLIKEKYRK